MKMISTVEEESCARRKLRISPGNKFFSSLLLSVTTPERGVIFLSVSGFW